MFMKMNRILPITLFAGALAFSAISCGEQKSAAENKATQMNDDTQDAMNNTETMATDKKDAMKSDMDDKKKMAMDKKKEMESGAMDKMDNMEEDMTMGKGVMVGGAMMSPTMTIVENASKASNLTTLVAAVKAAGLVETLQGNGPFTVFAPTNAAFDKLPSGTVETLLKPENKTKLQDILKYHVVAGKNSASDIVAAIKSGNGKAEFTTVEGEKLTAMLSGDKVMLKDAAGNTSTVTTADVNQKNGVVHVIDTVIMPGM